MFVTPAPPYVLTIRAPALYVAANVIAHSPRIRLLCGLAFALGAFLSGCTTVPTVMQPSSFTTVVIDAGHGGKDSGERSHSGLMEKDFTLDTALRLQPLLEKAGLHTVMTRTTDNFVELNDRVAIADQNPDSILVSIHYNASPSSFPRGIQTFFYQRNSYGLAIRVQRHLIEETGLDNRGVTRRVLRLTYNPRVPCILCECGFLTNPDEAATISEDEFRQRVAEGIAQGIIDQQEHGDVGVGTLPPITVTRPPVVHRRHAAHGTDKHTASKHSTSKKTTHSTSSAHRKHKPAPILSAAAALPKEARITILLSRAPGTTARNPSSSARCTHGPPLPCLLEQVK